MWNFIVVGGQVSGVELGEEVSKALQFTLFQIQLMAKFSRVLFKAFEYSLVLSGILNALKHAPALLQQPSGITRDGSSVSGLVRIVACKLWTHLGNEFGIATARSSALLQVSAQFWSQDG
jgi:hypothetical protein